MIEELIIVLVVSIVFGVGISMMKRPTLSGEAKEVIIKRLEFYRNYISELDSNYNQKKITREEYDSELSIIDKQLRDMERYLVWYTK